MNLGLAGAVVLLAGILSTGGSSVAPVTDIDAPPAYIMHAGGIMPDGRAGTNSIEAINYSYEEGYRWLEIDFNWTADGVPVCLHDWQSSYGEKKTGVPVPSLETFEGLRTSTYGYESPTLKTLTDWLWEHPGVMIVTDVKDDNLKFAEFISQNYPQFMDRFVIQIYSRAEYDFVAGCGFDKIIYTFYQEPPAIRYDTESLREFVAKSKKLVALTYAADETHPAEIAAMTNLGIPIYVHTVNDAEERAFWENLGVYGFYCDYVLKP